MRILLFLFLFSFSAASSQAQPTSPQRQQQFNRWLRELDADRFRVRELASQKLSQAGYEALPSLRNLLEDERPSAETIERGMRIIQHWVLRDHEDASLSEAAMEFLQKTADSQTRARGAALSALERIYDGRQKIAVKKLREGGAKVTYYNPSFIGAPPQTSFQIEIDKDWKGDEDALRNLRWLRPVRELTLSGPKINDFWLQEIGKMQEIGHLTIKRAEISDVGLANLEPIPTLQLLSLMYCPRVSDGAIPLLKKLDNVQKFRLYGLKMTPQGADALRAALAGAEVDYRAGAFLGVGCQPGPNGCVIYRVIAGSGAEKAGLKAGDQVLSYNGEEVDSFEGLTALISKNAPGEKAKVKVMRSGKELEKEIDLGEWD